MEEFLRWMARREVQLTVSKEHNHMGGSDLVNIALDIRTPLGIVRFAKTVNPNDSKSVLVETVAGFVADFEQITDKGLARFRD